MVVEAKPRRPADYKKHTKYRCMHQVDGCDTKYHKWLYYKNTNMHVTHISEGGKLRRYVRFIFHTTLDVRHFLERQTHHIHHAPLRQPNCKNTDDDGLAQLSLVRSLIRQWIVVRAGRITQTARVTARCVSRASGGGFTFRFTRSVGRGCESVHLAVVRQLSPRSNGFGFQCAAGRSVRRIPAPAVNASSN